MLALAVGGAHLDTGGGGEIDEIHIGGSAGSSVLQYRVVVRYNVNSV